MSVTGKFKEIVRLAGLLPLIALVSCSQKTPTGTSAANSDSASAPSDTPSLFYVPKGAVFDVKYTDNTVRIDLATVRKTLRSVSEDARVFVFEASDSKVADLQPGKVMFLEHLGARRVVAVQKQGAQIAVLTEAAALTDFIQDGRIEFSAPIDFRRRHAELLPAPISFRTDELNFRRRLIFEEGMRNCCRRRETTMIDSQPGSSRRQSMPARTRPQSV
jgi:hypothetical protein